jgi:uncharacterized protein
MELRFRWHRIKAASNLVKHGVSFEEAKTVFGDRSLITLPDPEHSEFEERFISTGISASNRLLTVSHTEDEDSIRIINAQAATRREAANYRSDR